MKNYHSLEMMNGFILLLFLPALAFGGKDKFKNGAPCRMQHTMKADRSVHGSPRDGDPPFDFTVKDENEEIVSLYEPGKEYTGAITLGQMLTSCAIILKGHP